MAPISPSLKQHLLAILRDDYDECRFIMATAGMLSHKFSDIADYVTRDNGADFHRLMELITEIGPLLRNTEKRLQDVDECYTKLIEALAAGKPGAQREPG